MNKKLILQGFVNAFCELVYIAIVATVMGNAQKLFVDKPGVIGIVSILTLLVVSVAVSGTLIFGRTVMLYLDGKKKQSLEILAYTIGWLAIIMIVLFIIMHLMK